MEDAEQLNSFLVDVFGRINKIEERAMAGGLGSAVSITEIHIIEKIGDREPVRMSEVARSIGVTLATLTVACDKLVAKGLVRRVRSQEDRRVVNIMLTDKGGISAKVDVSEMMGSAVHLHVNDGKQDIVIVVQTMDMTGHQLSSFTSGNMISFTFNGNVAHLFNKETGVNLEF